MKEERKYEIFPDPEKELAIKLKATANSRACITFLTNLVERGFGKQNIHYVSPIHVYENSNAPTIFVVFFDITLPRICIKNSKLSDEALIAHLVFSEEDSEEDKEGGWKSHE